MTEENNRWFAFKLMQIGRNMNNQNDSYHVYGMYNENGGSRVGSINKDFTQIKWSFGLQIPGTLSKKGIEELNMIFKLGKDKIDSMLMSEINYIDEWTE